MTFSYFLKNGKILPAEKAVVSVSNIEYSYGFGVYETIRVNSHIPYFLKEHLDRLEESAKIISLNHSFNSTLISQWVNKLIDSTSEPTFNIKILLIGASNYEDSQIFIMASSPLFPNRKDIKNGIKTITVPYERVFPHAKTLNMLQSYLAYKKAKEGNAYDALLINKKGEITEGTRTNVFFVKDNIVYSPPESDMLLGVMRSVVLKIIEKENIKYQEELIPLKEMQNFDGAFLTSTSSKILPIHAIDAYQFGETPLVISELIKKLDDFLDRCRGKIQ